MVERYSKSGGNLQPNIYKLPNGDYQLGDYKNRISPNGLNLVWVITHQCTFGCPYCVGWKVKRPSRTLIDKFSPEKLSKLILEFRDINKKDLYVTITGGEPTLVSRVNDLVKILQKNSVHIELHTNFVSDRLNGFFDYADVRMTSQIMATFHSWKLFSKVDLLEKYSNNFSLGTKLGHTVVVKKIVLPSEISNIRETIKNIKHTLSDNLILLPWLYISGVPISPTVSGGAYPQAYSKSDCLVLDDITKFRKTEQKLYRSGAGFFKGMRCSAGSAFVYMDIDGNIHRCHTLKNVTYGNIKNKVILPKNEEQCTARYCGTTFWGLWYGVDPWEYINGALKSDSYYCRYGERFNVS
jgi:organic radical activating enzyme